jgi:N-acyl-D-aspartate/D-glutamate deacylase
MSDHPSRLIAVLLLAFVMFAGTQIARAERQPKETPFDVILRRGTVFDGTGAAPFRADIGVRGGYIAEVGDLTGRRANAEFDLSGLYIAPGFINFHDHSESDALPTAENMLIQGVTTAVVNPDGHSPLDVVAQLADYRARPLALNVAASIGFNSVWESVVGQNNRRATPEEITRMQGVIVDNLRRGAWNVSAGLDYKPGYYATAAEVVSVIQPAASWRTSFSNHDRLTPESDYSSRVGMAETISIAEQAGLHPEITHMKVQGHEQGSAADTLNVLSAAIASGRYAAADVYPYLAGQTGLGSLIIPAWAQDGGRDAMLQRFKDPAQRSRIAHEAELTMQARFGGEHGVYVLDVSQSLTEVMQTMGVSAGEAVIRLLERADMRAILSFGREDDLQKILQFPEAAIACDCGASLRTAIHPRYYGTFPRVLGHYVREQKLLSWQDALRKMTGLPATMLGMVDRGYLMPGMAADITAFDPQTIIDHSSYERPTERPEGVRFVWVNGRLAVKDGKLTGTAAGHALLRAAFMPMRPESHGTRELSGGGTLKLDSPAENGPARLRISFHIVQRDIDRRAHGRITVQNEHGKAISQINAVGLLQVSGRWGSFTTYAFENGVGKALTVVLDRANPLTPGVQNLYLVEDDTATYAGTLDE